MNRHRPIAHQGTGYEVNGAFDLAVGEPVQAVGPLLGGSGPRWSLADRAVSLELVLQSGVKFLNSLFGKAPTSGSGPLPRSGS